MDKLIVMIIEFLFTEEQEEYTKQEKELKREFIDKLSPEDWDLL